MRREQRDAAIALTLLAGALLACQEQRPPMTSVLQGRVVRERSCGASNVSIVELGGGGYYVKACGFATTFSCARHVIASSQYGSQSTEQCIRESDWKEVPE